jgi:hypothetical protein
VGNSSPKGELIPHVDLNRMIENLKLEMALQEDLAAYQLVGEVMAHQG